MSPQIMHHVSPKEGKAPTNYLFETKQNIS